MLTAVCWQGEGLQGTRLDRRLASVLMGHALRPWSQCFVNGRSVFADCTDSVERIWARR